MLALRAAGAVNELLTAAASDRRKYHVGLGVRGKNEEQHRRR
jgi:hypothetical protein